MQSSITSSRGEVKSGLAIGLGLVAAVVVAGAVVLGGGRSPSAPAPSAPPASYAPSKPPTATPTPAPSDTPSTPPTTGKVTVDLEDFTGHDVEVVIDDESGDLVKAVSGKPGDGMSVAWNKAIVKQIDEKTVSVLWAGLPLDDTVTLSIAAKNGGYALAFNESGPYPNSDAMGADRILILTFDTAVSADDVTVSIEYHQ